jgi:hypothetical protein
MLVLLTRASFTKTSSPGVRTCLGAGMRGIHSLASSRVTNLEANTHRQNDVLTTYGMLMPNFEGTGPQLHSVMHSLRGVHDRRCRCRFYAQYQHTSEWEERDVYVNPKLKVLDCTAGQCSPHRGTEESGRSLKRWRSSMDVGRSRSVDFPRHSDNRNADNFDVLFQQHSLLMFPLTTVQAHCNATGVIVCLCSCQIGYGIYTLLVVSRL